jgi:hypothetical protein
MLAMLPQKKLLLRTSAAAWGVGLLALGAACADLHPPPPLGDAGAASNGGVGSTQGGQASSAAGGASSTGGSGASGASGAVSGSGGNLGSSAGAAAEGGAGSGSAGGGAGESCESVTTGDVHAWLYPELTEPRSNELHPFLALTTTGEDIALQRLAIRYYFSAEMAGDWEVSCIWVTKQTPGTSVLCEDGALLKIEAMDLPHTEADHYLEVSFPGVSAAEVLSDGQMPAFEARTMFWRTGHPTLNQSNDYSFVPTTENVMTVEGRDYKETTKVTVYLDGVLIWGTEPCP